MGQGLAPPPARTRPPARGTWSSSSGQPRTTTSGSWRKSTTPGSAGTRSGHGWASFDGRQKGEDLTKAIEPSTQTTADLRRLAARRERQEAALAETRDELEGVIARAVEREGATPQAVARLAGLTRPYIYSVIRREEARR